MSDAEGEKLDARKRVPPEGLASASPGSSPIRVPFEALVSAIIACRKEIPPERALLVGISGIDASGKGFIAAKVARSLGRPVGITDPGYNCAIIGVDGWLNLPHVRFAAEDPAPHFYHHALRFDDMFEQLIIPLQENRGLELEMDFTEEIATAYRKHRCSYRNTDIILLEGIFLFKRRYRHHFDLACWLDCSFETALARAVARCQEGLPRLETVRAFETIYFPAQQIHFHRDAPQARADLILPNDPVVTGIGDPGPLPKSDVCAPGSSIPATTAAPRDRNFAFPNRAPLR